MMYETHRSARNEFEILLVFMCLLVGGSQIITNEVPPSLQTFDTGFQNIWSWTLLTGAAITLFGIMWRDVYLALVLEMTGLMALGTVTFVYSMIAMFTNAQGGSLVGVPITLAFSAASFRRCYKIARKLFNKTERQESMLREMVVKKTMNAVDEAESAGPVLPIDVDKKPTDESGDGK